MIAAVVISALLAQAPVQTSQTATTQITSAERSSITELGLTEIEWQRYKTEMQGPRAKWSVDNDRCSSWESPHKPRRSKRALPSCTSKPIASAMPRS